MNRIGYCCIPLGCNQNKSKKDQILVNRGMVKRTFETKGLSYVSELILLNLKDTLKVLDYNIKNDIFVYRLSSDSFPWLTEYNFKDLPKFNLIEKLLKEIGDKIKSNNIRTSYHPGPFNVLASENNSVYKVKGSDNVSSGWYEPKDILPYSLEDEREEKLNKILK